MCESSGAVLVKQIQSLSSYFCVLFLNIPNEVLGNCDYYIMFCIPINISCNYHKSLSHEYGFRHELIPITRLCSKGVTVLEAQVTNPNPTPITSSFLEYVIVKVCCI
jgi:hypothetical protein